MGGWAGCWWRAGGGAQLPRAAAAAGDAAAQPAAARRHAPPADARHTAAPPCEPRGPLNPLQVAPAGAASVPNCCPPCLAPTTAPELCRPAPSYTSPACRCCWCSTRWTSPATSLRSTGWPTLRTSTRRARFAVPASAVALLHCWGGRLALETSTRRVCAMRCCFVPLLRLPLFDSAIHGAAAAAGSALEASCALACGPESTPPLQPPPRPCRRWTASRATPPRCPAA